MSMTDPVADFLTHIRNATMRKHATVESPASKLKIELAKVLKQEGFIEDWLSFNSEKGLPRIMVNLKYDEAGDSVLRGIKRISRPGLRRQAGYRDMSPVLAGQGIAIISTSKGMLTDYDCRQQKVGGEVICHVW
ncbi:MAG: 30S ribosomal protein S8 [SAR324 cluster bacterium]|nr:30S ribosomal protein S8 [SAR324 cluster bacterium]MCZ6532534.1 30S ribosomal protein S8 [SAR324 cluster bacterium]MCZ6558894.1 30S ribosomal protein S8 [SAR324 cluster bacterium]MCZ6627069.1 30S ribosomal protein S8 [SAR324 cluster bacterium]MCZ6646360.1 30S ribosomal protein S8 [SAR324 cluster bacterium]